MKNENHTEGTETMKAIATTKIRAELDNGFGQKSFRYGASYGQYNASALDAGIATRAKFAAEWRTALLAAVPADADKIEKRTIRFRHKVYPGMSRRKATVYSVPGSDVLIVVGGRQPYFRNLSGDVSTWLAEETLEQR